MTLSWERWFWDLICQFQPDYPVGLQDFMCARLSVRLATIPSQKANKFPQIQRIEVEYYRSQCAVECVENELPNRITDSSFTNLSSYPTLQLTPTVAWTSIWLTDSHQSASSVSVRRTPDCFMSTCCAHEDRDRAQRTMLPWRSTQMAVGHGCISMIGVMSKNES
jgi:hypothetical protein